MKHFGLLFNIIALGLFIPGILLPMFNLSMDINAQTGGAALNSEVINKQLSLLGTIKELWQDKRFLVAALIALFSIGIPLLKTSLIAWAYFIKNTQVALKTSSFVSAIGKWSMADVFVVAIFLAVLSTNHADTASHQKLVIFSFKLDVTLSSSTLSSVGEGFYYFASYCIVSLLGSQITQFALKRQTE